MQPGEWVRGMEKEDLFKQTQRLLTESRKKAGIDIDKVQKVASSYLQIARDNQLNYNELLQVLSFTKESVLQSLNKVAISALPDIISDAAKL